MDPGVGGELCSRERPSVSSHVQILDYRGEYIFVVIVVVIFVS